MNNLQPFEKHLADQLHQVPVPNEEQGWIEMRKLLDQELPEGGTAWSGNRKWWWMGLTVAIIITGLWMKEKFQYKQQVATNARTPHSEQQIVKSATSGSSIGEEKNSNNQSMVEKKSTHSSLNTIDAVKDDKQETASTLNIENSTKNRSDKSNEKYAVKDARYGIRSDAKNGQQDYLYTASNK